jgi:hypothetical protein
MGIKSGAGGMDIMGRDVAEARGTIGRQASTLAKAKSGGASIGGMLGAIVGQILIPIPGVGAAIGGALGGLAGSKIGGATSGVSQGDIMGNKFFKKSSVGIAEGIAKQEFTNVAMAAASGYMSAGSIGKGVDAFKGGMAGGGGLLGGLKGLGTHLIPGSGLGATKGGVEKMAGSALTGGAGAPNILDITSKVAEPSGLSKLYGGVDKFLGGALPGGEKLSLGSMGKAFGGLLGPKMDGSSQYQNGGGGNEGAMQKRVQDYMNKGWAPDHTIDPAIWKMMGGE